MCNICPLQDDPHEAVRAYFRAPYVIGLSPASDKYPCVVCSDSKQAVFNLFWKNIYTEVTIESKSDICYKNITLSVLEAADLKAKEEFQKLQSKGSPILIEGFCSKHHDHSLPETDIHHWRFLYRYCTLKQELNAMGGDFECTPVYEESPNKAPSTTPKFIKILKKHTPSGP